MAPNFLNAHEMPLTLPVDANCLHCHVSGVAQALPGARNHFAAAPFAHGGIGCASCHGDATEHVQTKGKAPVLNPAKLDAARRDSVCLQCHLEGETAVYRLGHSLATYRPGESLFDSVAYFVHQGEVGPEGRATSQYEALLQSACKRASGDTDDVHDVPRSARERNNGNAGRAGGLLPCEMPELPHGREVSRQHIIRSSRTVQRATCHAAPARILRTSK